MKSIKILASLAALVCVAAGCEWSGDVLDIEKEDCLIMPFDALSPEGEAVMLEARLEFIDGLSGIRGETLEFERGGEVIGREMTNAEGIARMEFRPPKTGDYVFTVKLAADSGRKAAPSPLTLCVRNREEEFIVTDVDKTIADADYLEFVQKEAKEIEPVKDSVKMLKDLSKHYTIIYLTAREELFRRKTKIWLEDKEFPVGPVFFWDVQRDELSHEKYKTELIAKLKGDWPNIRAGFGDLLGDARAYLVNGLRVYIVRRQLKESDEEEQAERAGFPVDVRFLESWKDKEMAKELLPEKD